MTSNQPPDQPDRASDSSNGDDNSREVAEIILLESRERRKGQECRLEHYQKLAIQVFRLDACVSGRYASPNATSQHPRRCST